MGQAFDTGNAVGVQALSSRIKEAGYDAVGLYYFHYSSYRTGITRAVAEQTTAAGLYILSLFENDPVGYAYFTSEQAANHAATALEQAKAAGQPEGTPIYFTVDYDAPDSNGPGNDVTLITDYFTAVREALHPVYNVGVYGSGMICQHLSDLGMVSHTWLSQSTGFNGYEEWKPQADIIQGPEETLFPDYVNANPNLGNGLDSDLDSTNGDAGGWMLWCVLKVAKS